MLQRIQTLFLLIVFIISITSIFLPFAGFKTDDLVLYAYGVKLNSNASGLVITDMTKMSVLLIMILFILVSIFTLFIIFKYNNRLLQIKSCRLSILIHIIIVVLIFYTTDLFEKELALKAQYKLGAVLPLISLILLYLSISAIRKDENLVKSANRLR